MKKLMFVLMVVFFVGQCMAADIYTATGRVLYWGTNTGVPNATVNLSGVGGCSDTTTSSADGSFTLQCLVDMGGTTVTLTAQTTGGLNGSVPINVSQNGTYNYKNIYVMPTFEPIPSLNIPTMPANITGSPGPMEYIAPFQIQATGAPVQIQNAQVNIFFNGAIQGVNDVVSTTGTSSFSYSVPVPGQLVVNAEFDPPKPPDFPAESFFDVFFEVEIPESGVVLSNVTIQDSLFNLGSGSELSAIPSVTEYLVGDYEHASPYFLVDSEDEWLARLNDEWPDVHIRAMTQEEGDAYLLKLFEDFIEGEPYSPIDPLLPDFIPADPLTGNLYVYGGGDDGNPDNDPDPEDAGLVMEWGDDTTPDEERASAWKLEYGDPDLSNCIITVTATPPGPSGINRISLGMQDINGNIRSWWWNVPSAIPYTVPTTVTIDTTQIGIGATNPPASGFANNAAFNLTQVASIIADENANWVGGSVPAPAPGGSTPKVWNYWGMISVTPKLPGGGANSKWYVKWSQPPVELEPGLIDGWDEQSLQTTPPIMADDWQCDSDRPVTDIHWWGSFVGWTQPMLPPIVPSAFHIGIWTDVPDPNPGTPGDGDWSHPGTLVWENVCDSSVWNFAGYDLDPRDGDPDQTENEACFQWAQFLSQDEWFHQEEGTNVYWLSIAAIYPAGTDFQDPDFYPWGWKTRPHFFNDDAVRIQQTSDGTWPPVLGSTCNMTDVDPVEWPQGTSWDLAFELTTNEPAYIDDPIPGDLTGPGGDMIPDGTVNLSDLAIFGAHWLDTVILSP